VCYVALNERMTVGYVWLCGLCNIKWADDCVGYVALYGRMIFGYVALNGWMIVTVM
jgi:hypothetical protein